MLSDKSISQEGMKYTKELTLYPGMVISIRNKPYSTRPTFIVFARGIEQSLEGPDRTSIRKKTRKEPPFSAGKEERIGTWYADFSGQRCKELLERYCEEPYESVCLALVPGIKKNIPLYRFLLPGFLFRNLPKAVAEEEAIMYVDEYYLGLMDELRGNFDNHFVSKRRFMLLVRRIRRIAQIFETKTTIDFSELKELNQLSAVLAQVNDVTMDFLQSILDSLMDVLLRNRIVGQCQFCGDFFRYNPRVAHKKFCSFKSEGKDCGKKTRYRRWYEKNKDEVRRKQREEMRDTRARYPELGRKK